MIKQIFKIKSILLSLVLTYTVLAHSEQIQHIEKIEGTEKLLEKRIERLISARRPSTSETGTAKDLFLLHKHRPFYLELAPSVTYTNNAFAQPEKDSDFFVKSRLKLGAETLISGRFSVDLNLNYSTTRYSKFSELDFDNYGIDTSVSTYIGPVIVGFNYQYNSYTESDLHDKLLSTDTISGYAVFIKPLSNSSSFLLQGSLGYTFANPNDYEYSSIIFSPTLFHRITNDLTISESVWWSRKNYNNYFEEVFDESREDDKIGASLKLNYKPQAFNWLSLDGVLSYSNNNSTIDDYDFESFETTGFIQFIVRF